MHSEEIKIRQHLKSVLDPELMVNIIDLGLVYYIGYEEAAKKILVEMTFTTAGCPMGDVITLDARELLQVHYPAFEIEIRIVWDPAWNPGMMTEEGKSILGNH